MIKRILDPDEFKVVMDDIFSLFAKENESEGHACGLLHDKESIINNLGNKILLCWDVFVWASKTDGTYDSIVIFINDKNIKFGKTIFSEFLWLSKNPKVGYKLFKEAVAFARSKDYEYISISSSANNPNTPKYEKFYKKIGFIKDSTNFMSKL